ncbi:MAG: efflux RND transporter periplasmic adaptor subunit [Candidatus Thiodiazotropha sp.]
MIFEKHPRRRMLLILPPILVGVLVLMLMAGNRKPPQQAETTTPAKPVRTFAVQEVDLVPVAEGYGSVKPAQLWTAVAEVSGRIVELHPRLRDGEILPAGTPLLRIDPVDYELNLAQAQAALAELEVQQTNSKATLEIEQRNLKIAEREYDRISKLAAKGTASRSDQDDAERNLVNSRNAVQNIRNTLALIPTQRKVLQAKQTQAERDLANTQIVAPFNLRVANLQIENNQYVSKGQSLFEGDSVDRVEVLAQFPLNSLRRLFIGREDISSDNAMMGDNLPQMVELKPLVRLDMGTTQAEWQAEFVRFSDNVDPQTRTMGVVVAVDKPFEKVKPGIRPPLSKGMFVQVLLSGRRQPNRLVVPRAAVRDSQLYLVNREQRLQRQPVEVLFNQGPISVLASGLKAGDQVVVSDLVPAVDGMPLTPQDDPALAETVAAAARGEL